jgi:hypothetical protein
MIRVEEQRLAKRDLIQALKSAGIRPASYSHAQLMAEARKRSWCYAHIAFRNVLQMQLEDLLRRAELKTCARNSETEKSMASVAQMSRTLEGVK